MKAYWEMKDVPDPLGVRISICVYGFCLLTSLYKNRRELLMIVYFALGFCLPAIIMLIADPWTGVTVSGSCFPLTMPISKLLFFVFKANFTGTGLPSLAASLSIFGW